MMCYISMISQQSVDDFSCSGVLYDSKGEVVDDIFEDGKSLKELRNEKFTIIVNEEKANTKGTVCDKISAFVQDAGTVFILSKKACDFFLKNGVANLEFFDLTIKGKNVHLTSHKLVKVVDEKIECIDNQKSDLTYNSKGRVSTVDYLELDESKIPNDRDLFLLGPFLSAQVFLRPELAEKIQNELTGFDILRADEFFKL